MALDFLITNNRVVDANQTVLENITHFIDANNPPVLTSTAQGGYATAQLTLTMREVDAYRLLDKRLGCRLVVTSPLANNPDMIAWEGMIYTVSIDNGKNAVSRTLSNLYNQVRVSYSTISFDASGNPVFGAQVKTADANYTANQTIFGIRELMSAQGGMTAAGAAQLRDVLLNQYKLALAQQTGAQRGGGGSVSDTQVTLDCVGWWETLDKRFYTQTAVTANGNVDVPLKACLTGVGQFVNSDQSNIVANTFQTTRYSDANLTAQGYLNKLCALGGPGGVRYYLQLLEQGKPYYFEEPTTPAYYTPKLDPRENVYDALTGQVVPPWLVLPGKLCATPDLLPDALSYTGAYSNVRNFLIGETQYTAPNLLTLVPLERDPSQLNLTRLGLAGN